MPFAAGSPPNPALAASRDLHLVAAGTGLGLFGSLFRQGITALTVLLLARLLSHHDFGLVQLGISFVVLLSLVGKLGFDVVVTRFTAIHLAAGDLPRVKGVIYVGLFWAGLFSVLLAVATNFFAPGIARLFLKPDFAAPLRYFAWWIPALVLGTVSSGAILARGSARARVYVRDVLMPALYLLFALVALLLRPSAAAIGLAYTLSAFGGLALALVYLRRSYPLLPSLRGLYEHSRLLAVGLPNMLTDLASTGLTQSDVVVVGRLLEAAHLGVYAAASHLSLLGTLPLSALNQIFSPVVSRLHHQGKTAELNYLLKTFSRLALAAALPVLLIFAALARPLMGLLGPGFLEGAPVLLIASAGILANVATGPVGYALVMAGYQWLTFANNLLFLGLLVAGMWWLTPTYGLIGAATALATASALVNLVRLLLVHRLLRVNPLSLAMFKPLLAAAVAGAITNLGARAAGLRGTEALYLLLPAVVGFSLLGAGMYVGLLLALGIEPADRQAAGAVWSRLRAQFRRGE